MVKIAVIPARGGSKRIPMKNMVNFDGKPLIHRTIRCALDSNIFDEVIVSTDDPITATFAESIGAVVPGLREIYQDDSTPSSQVTLYELDRFFKRNKYSPDVVFQLMPTCPFRTTDDLHKVNDLLLDDKNRSVVTCASPIGGNIWWSASIEPDLRPIFLFPEKLNTRSQDLPRTYVPNGSIWASNVSVLEKFMSFYNPTLVFCDIPWLSGFDIDTPEDLDIARRLI